MNSRFMKFYLEPSVITEVRLLLWRFRAAIPGRILGMSCNSSIFFCSLPELDQVARTEERSQFDGSLGLQSYLWKGGIKGPLNPCPFHRLSEGSGGALRAKNRHNEKHRVIQAVTFKRGPVSEWRPDLCTQRLETSNDEVKGHSLNRQVLSQMLYVWYIYLHLPYKIAKCRWIHQTLSIMGMFLQVA